MSLGNELETRHIRLAINFVIKHSRMLEVSGIYPHLAVMTEYIGR
jgi:hypothetical protein